MRLTAVTDIEEALFKVRRKRRARGGGAVAAFRCHAFTPDEYLRHILPVDRENLDPLAAAVRHVDEPVIGHSGGVHRRSL